jgi:hypothetical protein
MIVDQELELERLDEPDTLPQDIVEWQPGRRHLVDMQTPRVSTGFFAAAALGAVAVGAVAIGAVAIGRLAIGRARIRHLEIDELTVRRLTILEP